MVWKDEDLAPGCRYLALGVKVARANLDKVVAVERAR